MKCNAAVWILAWVGISLTLPAAGASRNSQAKKKATQIAMPQLSEDQSWSLLLPADKQIAFHGVVSYDKAGGSTRSMMYPAPNAAGLLAAVITHGIISQASRASEKTRIQKEADAVVAPYETTLTDYGYAELFAAGVPKVTGISLPMIVEPGAKPATKWVAESLPAYFMAPGADAIWIENVLAIYDSEAPKRAVYPMTVKVLSRDRINLTEQPNYWQEQNGQRLKSLFERLFAESVELARHELTQTLAMGDSEFETVRYFQGGVERMERGKVIQKTCDRVVLKTLRGWIMSVPTYTQADEAPENVSVPATDTPIGHSCESRDVTAAASAAPPDTEPASEVVTGNSQ